VSYYSSALSKLRNKIDGSKMNIAFTTDSHYTWGTGKVNAWYGLPNLNNILSLSDKVDIVISGGDNCDGGNYSKLGNLSNSMDYVNYFFHSYPGTDRFIIRGNHDSGGIGPYNATGKIMPGDVITKEEFKKLYKTKEKLFGEIRDEDSIYGYKDYSEKKVRVIWIDSLDNPENLLNTNGSIKYPTWRNAGYQERQMKWIAEEALGKCPDDYHVAIFSHYPLRWNSKTEPFLKRNFESMALIIKSFINKSSAHIYSSMTDYKANFLIDYTKRNQANFVGWFCGHEHWDGIRKTENFQNIICRNAWCDYEADSVPETVYEDCFRIIEIDAEQRKVNLKGFGRSKDHSFSY
jgi:hypothetical protein